VALIVDAGPLYASLDRRDAYHRACRTLIEGTDEEVVIPVPVIAEVDYFIQTRAHPGARLDFLDNITSGAFRVENLLREDFVRIRQLCDRYADSDIGFVDAAVLAIVERLNERKLATLDHRHFGVLRPRHVESLTLLP
jgi:uncharacterized protein